MPGVGVGRTTEIGRNQQTFTRVSEQYDKRFPCLSSRHFCLASPWKFVKVTYHQTPYVSRMLRSSS